MLLMKNALKKKPLNTTKNFSIYVRAFFKKVQNTIKFKNYIGSVLCLICTPILYDNFYDFILSESVRTYGFSCVQ